MAPSNTQSRPAKPVWKTILVNRALRAAGKRNTESRTGAGPESASIS